jgi:carbon storage regulator
MLVMTRRKNEAIIINDDISVTVVEIWEDKVRLGVENPRDISVHRKEVYDAILGSGDFGRNSTMRVPKEGTDALATIRSQISSSLPDDRTLIATILEAVAAKGIAAEDLSSFVKEI